MKTGCSKTIAIVLCVGCLAGQGALAGPPQRHAVVIGVDRYEDLGIQDAKYAASDARSMYESLIDPDICGFPKGNVQLLLGKGARGKDIKVALHRLRSVGKDDLVLIFFAGCVAREAEETFLLPHDTEHQAIMATGLSEGDIAKFLNKIPSKRVLFFLDACVTPTVPKAMRNPSNLFESLRGNGRDILAAVGATPQARLYENRHEGVFSHFVLAALREGVNSPTGGRLTFEQAWTFISAKMAQPAVKQPGFVGPVRLAGSQMPEILLRAPRDSEQDIARLEASRSDGAITKPQYEIGRKALSGPAIDAAGKVRRRVFIDLIEGRVLPKNLQTTLDAETVNATSTTDRTSGTKPTLAIIDLDELGNVKTKDAGKILAEHLLLHFGDRYEPIDLNKLQAFLDHDDLTKAGLVALSRTGRDDQEYQKTVKLRSIMYLVVGSIAVLPDGSLTVSARMSDWQNGKILRSASIRGEDWQDLIDKLKFLAAELSGRKAVQQDSTSSQLQPSDSIKPSTNAVKVSNPAGATLIIGGKRFRIRSGGTSLNLAKGTYPFEIRISSTKKLFGSLEMLVVDSDTENMVFGMGRKSKLFKQSHISAALQGRPVSYKIRITTETGTKTVIHYRLGLRPMK